MDYQKELNSFIRDYAWYMDRKNYRRAREVHDQMKEVLNEWYLNGVNMYPNVSHLLHYEGRTNPDVPTNS